MLDTLKNAKIGTRVYLGFAVALTSLVILSIAGTLEVRTIDANLTQINDKNGAKLRFAINMRGSVHDRAIAIRDIVLLDDPAEIERTLVMIEELRAQYIDAAGPMAEIFETDTTISDEERTILAGITEIEVESLPFEQAVIDAQGRGQVDIAKIILLGQSRPAFTVWLQRINTFIDYQEAQNQVTTAETRAVAAEFSTLMIGLTAAAIIISGLLVLWIRNSVQPLGRLTGVIGELSQGNLSVEIPKVTSRDEVGQITDAVQVFRDNALEVEELQKSAKEKEEKAREERKKEMLSLADRLETSVGSVLGQVSEAAENMQGAAQNVMQTAEQTSTNSRAVAEAAQQANSDAQQVNSAADALAGAVRNISSQTDQSLEAAREAVKRTERAGENIARLTDSAQSIGDVIDLINNIADQTNLLALNATIEAARAGEAGKGFAVVAGEVKNLANQTTRAVQEVIQQVNGMQEATETTVASLNSIATIIRDIEGTATEISQAVDQQQASTDEIASSIEKISASTDLVSTNIENVSNDAVETNNTSQEVRSVAAELGKHSGTVSNEINNFLSTIRAG